MASITCGKCGETHPSTIEVRKCYGALPDAEVRLNTTHASVPNDGINYFLTDMNREMYDNHQAELASQWPDQQEEPEPDPPAYRARLDNRPGSPNDKFYLEVPYPQKNAAKELGARWDKDAKKWWIPGDWDTNQFSRWLPDGPKPQRLGSARAKSLEVEDGFYMVGGDIYKVVHNQEGSGQYAKRLSIAQGGSKGVWAYVPGAMQKIEPHMQLKEAEAAQFGKLYGFCAICGRQLTNEESIERGIGPVCAGKQGW